MSTGVRSPEGVMGEQPLTGEPTALLARVAAIFDLRALPRSAIVATLASNILNLAMPLVVLQVYDRIIPNSAMETLVVVVGALVLVIVVDATLKIARAILLGWWSGRQAESATVRAAALIAASPCERIVNERATDWLDRVDAAAQIEHGRGGQAQLALLDCLFLPIFPLVIFLVAGSLVIVPIAVMVVLAILVWRNGGALGAAIAERNEHDRRKQDFLTECLGGIHNLKALAMEPQMMRRYERLAKTGASISQRTIEASQALQTTAGVMATVSMVALVSAGSLYVIYGDLSTGALACCSLLAGRMMQPVLRGAGVWSELQGQLLARERAAPLAALALPTRAGPVPAPGDPIAITVDRVCLSGEAGRADVGPITMAVAPGEIIGLSGDGGGWSALFDAICGDLTARSGRVLVGGVDSQDAAPTLRQTVIRVSASSQLFAGSIIENLTLFEGGEAVDRARTIAREIGLEARINRLPKGYDTLVGHASSAVLPGGMLQQIAIARALAREPAALLFNEANTALDAQADTILREALRERAGRMTILLASNRPSLLRIADRQFALVDGEVHEAGGSLARPEAAMRVSAA